MSEPEASQEHPPADDATGRRALLIAGGAGLLGAGCAAVFGYPVYRYLNTPVQREATAPPVTERSLPDAVGLEPGNSVMFKFGTSPAILIRNLDGSWASFSARCTHLGCTVQYQPEKKRIFCACHSGVYDPATGEPLAGPPPKGLTKYAVEVRDDRVVVSRI
jgi:cytochrome b6-f complex iron-sulfur subunit